MSESVPEEAFLDTSVCLNYALNDDGGYARRLLPGRNFDPIVSDTVEQEFHSVKSRRESICREFIPYVKRGEIEQFEPSNPERLTSNDWDFIEELADTLSPLSETEAVERINEKLDVLQAGYEDLFLEPNRYLIILPPQDRDGHLLRELESEIQNQADRRIICDAVEWCAADRGNHFITSDREDVLGSRRVDPSSENSEDGLEGGSGLPDSLVGFVNGNDRSKVEHINHLIERNYSDEERLDFYSVPEFLSDYPSVDG